MFLVISSWCYLQLWLASGSGTHLRYQVGPFIHLMDAKQQGLAIQVLYLVLSHQNPNTKKILLYDVQTGNLDAKLSDGSNSSSKGRGLPLIPFSPPDTMILWNGVL